LSPFNSEINLYQSQINTTESKINLFNTNILKLSGHFNDSISQNKTVKVDQFVNNTIEVHTSVITPVGSLKNWLTEWRLITDNQYILDIVENGYKIPFKTEPEQIYINNNKSSLENKDVVASEITNLLNKGCIREVSTKSLIVNPLTVAFSKSSKPRLVLDCRHINPHLHKYRFICEDGKVAREMFDVGDFIFSYDLKSAYHHIEIFEELEHYLGLAWFFGGKIRYFVFAVLSFGISTTGYIFSKVLREVVKDFRSKGKRIIMFLDDGLAGENDYDTAVKSSREVNDQLQNFGFLIAHDKCHWSPCQKLDWLGYSWDTENGIIFVKEERIQKLEKCFTYALCQVENGKNLISC
jgi:hypothetical protein